MKRPECTIENLTDISISNTSQIHILGDSHSQFWGKPHLRVKPSIQSERILKMLYTIESCYTLPYISYRLCKITAENKNECPLPKANDNYLRLIFLQPHHRVKTLSGTNGWSSFQSLSSYLTTLWLSFPGRGSTSTSCP